jgi:hypothetical protein
MRASWIRSGRNFLLQRIFEPENYGAFASYGASESSDCVGVDAAVTGFAAAVGWGGFVGAEVAGIFDLPGGAQAPDLKLFHVEHWSNRAES